MLFRAAEPLIDAARAATHGRGGRAPHTFDRLNRSLAAAPALRQFLQNAKRQAARPGYHHLERRATCSRGWWR